MSRFYLSNLFIFCFKLLFLVTRKKKFDKNNLREKNYNLCDGSDIDLKERRKKTETIHKGVNNGCSLHFHSKY